MKQRHAVTEGAGAKSHQTFQKIQRRMDKFIPKYMKSMVGEGDDYASVMKLPDIKVQISEDVNLDET